jgi:NADP-dependent 3-hydroxy acid dehydrogenase YdfG
VIAGLQTFLPMIRAAKGRIVLMGSNSGFKCEPFAAPYGARRHAIETIADSLRGELHPFQIRVALNWGSSDMDADLGKGANRH